MVIYGVEGIGKSTLASYVPHPLFLDTENGTSQLDVERTEIETLNDLGNALSEILSLKAENKLEYKSVVIDSGDNLWRYCAEYVCQQNNWENLEKAGYNRGYVMTSNMYDVVLCRLDDLMRQGVHVIVVCHAKIDRISPPDNPEYTKYCLKVTAPNKQAEASREKMKEWCDCMLFCHYDITVDGNKGKTVGESKRVIYTTSSPAWEAKNRYGLPETMEMNADTMRAVFEAAGCKQMFTQQATQSPEKEPETASKKLIVTEEVKNAIDSLPVSCQPTTDDELVRYFTGIGKLQLGQGLEDLPENLKAALKARPEAALAKAREWNAKH